MGRDQLLSVYLYASLLFRPTSAEFYASMVSYANQVPPLVVTYPLTLIPDPSQDPV
jgi:hypothetical protein